MTPMLMVELEIITMYILSQVVQVAKKNMKTCLYSNQVVLRKVLVIQSQGRFQNKKSRDFERSLS